MSDKITRQVVDFKSSLTIVSQGASVEKAIKEGRFISILGVTGPIQQANADQVIASGVPSAYHPVNTPVCGSLMWYTQSDSGTGQIIIGLDGTIKAQWSKATTYGLAFALCYAV